jgi:hypothetical protein
MRLLKLPPRLTRVEYLKRMRQGYGQVKETWGLFEPQVSEFVARANALAAALTPKERQRWERWKLQQDPIESLREAQLSALQSVGGGVKRTEPPSGG